MRDNITNSELPDIQASDLDVATQGAGLGGFEHIETRVCKSDGDTNFQTDLTSYTYDGAVIDFKKCKTPLCTIYDLLSSHTSIWFW